MCTLEVLLTQIIVSNKSNVQSPYYKHNTGLHIMYGELHIFFVKGTAPETMEREEVEKGQKLSNCHLISHPPGNTGKIQISTLSSL